MSDFFKKVTKSWLPVALTGKDEGAFFAGFVENADEEFLFMQAVSPSGHFDGWACVRIEEIARADVATEYLVMLARVFEYYGEEFREPKISARDVLASFIDQAIKNKWLCTAEVGFETLDKLTGYFVEKDFDTVQMSLVNANGKRDGFTSFDFEEIVFITAQGEREKYLETVMEMLASGTESVYDGLRGGAAGREKPSKKKNGQDGVRQDDKPDENGRVITFPKKDK